VQQSAQVASEVTEVLSAAQSLARESDRLKSQVEQFLETVRAA
jgi:hypothetical protein